MMKSNLFSRRLLCVLAVCLLLTALLPMSGALAETALASGTVNSAKLNMRDGADHHLITSVPNGTLVKLTGTTREDWTEAVTGDGTVGWLFTKFLIKHNVG